MGCVLRKTKRSDTSENDSPVVHSDSLNDYKGAKTTKDSNETRYKVIKDDKDDLSIHSDSSDGKKDGRLKRIGWWKGAKKKEKTPDSANFYDKSSDHYRHTTDNIPQINKKEKKGFSFACCRCCKSSDTEMNMHLTPSEYYKLREEIDRKYYGMDRTRKV